MPNLVTITRPTLRKIENDWNQFRGPERNGHIPTTNLPVDWKIHPKLDGPLHADRDIHPS